MTAPALAGDPAPVPAHVPPELVTPFTLRHDLGSRPHDRVASLHPGPNVVYTPYFHIPRQPGGAWVLTRAADIRAALGDTTNFSSQGTSRFSDIIGGGVNLIPLELDPPEHAKFRSVIMPIFAPNRMKFLEDKVRERAGSLAEACFAKGDGCDFVAEFSRPFPAGIFLDMMGLPNEHLEQCTAWAKDILAATDREKVFAAMRGVRDFLLEQIEMRRKKPTDDLLSVMVHAKVDDRLINDTELIGFGMLLFGAGLDTVEASMGFHFRHLAEHPEHQDELRRNPDLIPKAVEEYFRAFGVVNATRIARHDFDLHGAPIKAGDRVTCSAVVAGRDPNEYADPDRVDFHRDGLRHLGFGTGIHLCIGAPLARREIAAAMAHWLSRTERFWVEPGFEASARGGGAIALTSLPLRWSLAKP